MIVRRNSSILLGVIEALQALTPGCSSMYQSIVLDRDWVPTREVAWAFGVSIDTVANWSRTKTFPTNARSKIGTRNLWHLPTITHWYKMRAASSPSRLGHV